jgi:NAD(P)-dependent dehydrogenase (short-subunit alcohol dehydrogenase family)
MPSRAILLAGAAGGIGRVMAEALLAAGHSVAAVDRDAAGLARFADMPGARERLYAIAADLAGEAGCLRRSRRLARASARSTPWSTMRASA